MLRLAYESTVSHARDGSINRIGEIIRSASDDTLSRHHTITSSGDSAAPRPFDFGEGDAGSLEIGQAGRSQHHIANKQATQPALAGVHAFEGRNLAIMAV